jgi:hypothetical protein
MRINCLACGHKVDLDDAYDDYEGPVKCFACRAILEIRTEQGRIKAVKQVNIVQHPSAEEVFERVLNPMNEATQGAGASGPRRIG